MSDKGITLPMQHWLVAELFWLFSICKHPKIKDFDKNLKSRIAKTVIKIEFKQKIVSVYCSSMFVHA